MNNTTSLPFAKITVNEGSQEQGNVCCNLPQTT